MINVIFFCNFISHMCVLEMYYCLKGNIELQKMLFDFESTNLLVHILERKLHPVFETNKIINLG